MRDKRIVLCFLLLALFLVAFSPALADDASSRRLSPRDAFGPMRREDASDGEIRVLSNTYEADFPNKVTFRLIAESEEGIEEITLFYRIRVEPITTNRAYPDFSPGERVEVEQEWDVRRYYIPPGVEVEYYWRIKDGAGHELETEPVSFTYTDTRFDWRELSSDRVILYWYQGDDEFGQALFAKALEAVERLSEETGVTVERAVKIFIYGSHGDLLGALEEGAQEWTGGVSFSEYGIVLIGVSPGNLAWGERAVAHELSHAILHKATENPFSDLPRWLDEGLAMRAEGELEPSYVNSLNRAIETNSLISVRSVSSTFPADADLAHLCYAESYSLVEFILDHYGQGAMRKLISIFAEGAYYDDALKEALGVDTDGLEDGWREAIGAPPRGAVVVTPTAEERPSGRGVCCLPLASLIIVGILYAIKLWAS